MSSGGGLVFVLRRLGETRLGGYFFMNLTIPEPEGVWT